MVAKRSAPKSRIASQIKLSCISTSALIFYNFKGFRPNILFLRLWVVLKNISFKSSNKILIIPILYFWTLVVVKGC